MHYKFIYTVMYVSQRFVPLMVNTTVHTDQSISSCVFMSLYWFRLGHRMVGGGHESTREMTTGVIKA
jgi:hypothetical protein